MSAVSSMKGVEIGFSAIPLASRFRLQLLPLSTPAAQDVLASYISLQPLAGGTKRGFTAKIHNFCRQRAQDKDVPNPFQEFLCCNPVPARTGRGLATAWTAPRCN